MALVAPSILAADLSELGAEVRAVEAAGADWIHIDVMDGHFVPNLTMGPDIVRAVDRVTDLPLDVHLMIEKPGDYVEAFASAGADYLSVHIEAVDDVETIFRQIERHHCKPALVLNPDTPVEAVSPYVSRAAMILVMSVHPGFAGQGFIPSALPKLRALRDLKKRYDSGCLLEIDGGIKVNNADQVRAAGADVIVSGSGVFSQSDYASAIAAIRGSPEP